jgi:hypothetical protein
MTNVTETQSKPAYGTVILYAAEKETPMQETVSLNDLFKKYSQGMLARQEFEGVLFEYALENNQRFHLANWEHDEYADYLSWLYPRMKRAIDKYQEAGASFETYIGAIMRWSAREYRFKTSNYQITEYTTWSFKTMDMMLHENEPEYLASERQPRLPYNSRQLLILILKSYYFVSDDFVTRIAPALKMEKEILFGLLAKVRELRAERDAEINTLRERCHGQFYRCMAYEQRLRTTQENSAFHILLQTRLERARRRLLTIRKRLARTRLEASNTQVARILGIPKGSVDSAMFWLKNRMSRETHGRYKEAVEA